MFCGNQLFMLHYGLSFRILTTIFFFKDRGSIVKKKIIWGGIVNAALLKGYQFWVELAINTSGHQKLISGIDGNLLLAFHSSVVFY